MYKIKFELKYLNFIQGTFEIYCINTIMVSQKGIQKREFPTKLLFSILNKNLSGNILQLESLN